MFEPVATDLDRTPRRETFLARYPRRLKLGATGAIAAVLIAVTLLPHLQSALTRPHPRGATPQAGIAAEGENVSGTGNNPPGGKTDADISAAALNDQDDRSIKLLAAPDSRVTEENPQGGLPRVSEDGLHPWQVYARPFNAADKRPRVALIVTDLGLSRAITDQAINQLPPTVTLSFNAQSPLVRDWNDRARQDGHETLLQVPMEPFDYPRSDPGPGTLLTSLPNSDNLDRLAKVMRRASGYVGLTTISGSRFTTDSTKFASVVNVLRDRGLMVLDARAAPHSVVTDMARSANVPVATVTERLDGDLSPEAIASALDDLEKTARQNGRAVGITEATPVMLAQVQAWLKNLPQRGIALAPISAMVQ